MKYIRTKDELGILIEPTDNEELQKLKVGVNDMIFSTWYGNDRNHIIKQADTIEELCDGICAIERNGKLKVPYVGKTAQDLKVIIDLIDKDNYEVYGAIWTEKGLIYVAKMNEKGELDLL